MRVHMVVMVIVVGVAIHMIMVFVVMTVVVMFMMGMWGYCMGYEMKKCVSQKTTTCKA